MSRNKKSPVSSIVIFALALLMFVAAVGLGISMLKKPSGDKPASDSQAVSDSESNSESESESSSGSESQSSSSGSSSSSASGSSSSSATSSSGASGSTSGSASGSTAKPVVKPMVFDPETLKDSGASNIANYKKINADVKGWLKVPDTNISYPVLHDADPSHFYLDHDIYKAKSKNGVVYADPAVRFGGRNQISDNNVLYGHNWTNYSANPKIGDANDVMFAQLAAYHHLDFAKAHPYIFYSTENEEMTWQVFAAFYTDIDFYYNIANPKSKSDYDYIIQGAKSRSRHIFDTPVTSSDKIITLSTCTRAYGKSDRQRFVVMAKLMPKGAATKAISVTANPKPVLPKL